MCTATAYLDVAIGLKGACSGERPTRFECFFVTSDDDRLSDEARGVCKDCMVGCFLVWQPRREACPRHRSPEVEAASH